MPADSDAADAAHLQPPAVQPKPVAVLLEPVAGEPSAALEARVAGLVPRPLSRRKNTVEGALHVGDDQLQNVAVDVGSERERVV
jgi:hypothetical protein